MKATNNHNEPWLDSFSQKLQDYEEPLPSHSWEQMEARLQGEILRPEKQKSRFHLKPWMGVAAALVVAVFSLYFFTQKQEVLTSQGKAVKSSLAALADKPSLSLPVNVTSLFCEDETCYYLDHNMVDRARIYAVNEGGIALFTAKRDGFELAGQEGLDSALQASLLQSLNNHRQLFLQSVASIFRKSREIN